MAGVQMSRARVPDKYMADDVGKFSLKFFDPTIKFIFSSSSRLGDYSVYTAPCG
jgi:hypothetical protein